MRRVLCYVRVSTQEQAREGYSIDEQIDRLSAYCTAKNWTITKIYTDAGYSGSNQDRPALQDMIRAVIAGGGDTVLVYKLDRLSRSQKDTLELIEDVFLAHGVDFVSMNENFDTSTPFGRAMIGILAVFAQLEREQIKERMALGREGRAKNGLYHGGPFIPIGYRYVDGDLVLDDYEAMQVKELYDLFLRGTSVLRIEHIFAEKGYTHHSGASWNTVTIRNVLRNDVYIGNVRFDGKSFKGTHNPIIDPDAYYAVQKIMDERAAAHRQTSRSLLGGMLRCARCGARYHAERTHGRAYYLCYSRSKAHRSMIVDPECRNAIWRMSDLDQAILAELRKLALDPDYIRDAKREDNTDTIRDEIAKIDAQRSRLLDLYTVGGFTIDELKGRIAALSERRKRLEAELSEDRPDAKKIVASIGDILDRGQADEIRILIESLIDVVEIDGKDLTIRWKI